MLEILFTIVFCWLFFKAVKLALKVAWGGAKALAVLLMAVALPLLVLGVIAGLGAFLLLPVVIVVLAFGLLKKVC